ncbi:replication associated protein [Janusivirus portis]|uniref:Replication-associated protein n=1 Tax=Caesalpinia pluviosa associated gemycircularvirus TaxID=2763230 RepID=A0A7G8FH22_9VIRU|nr:replication associated protein [Caesalpinia pluviosa associated gemycircularvirus]
MSANINRRRQSKSWCFTYNNYTDADYTRICESLDRLCSYYCIGKEVGAQGTPHLQGYAYFTRRTSFVACKRAVGDSAHIEPARGTPANNREYCSKEGSFHEHGDLPSAPGSAGGAAARETRDTIAREFVTGVHGGREGLAEFIDRRPGTWFFSGHNLLRNYLTSQPTRERLGVNTKWYLGPPGVGKSRKAHQLLPNAYVKDPRTKWWNGYMLEEDVIIDDFGPRGIDINHLLRWFDLYKCYVETKGGMVPLYAVNFVVTSNFTPSECFFDHVKGEDDPQLPALMRRLEIISVRRDGLNTIFEPV